MSLTLAVLSFVAGILTVLAPCVLPLLPIIIGGSAAGKGSWRPLVITVSLGVSILIFTVFLRLSFGLIPVPLTFWRSVSGGLVVLIGLVYAFPGLWDAVNLKLNLSGRSDKLLNETGQKSGLFGAVLTGAALGPVFSSCSPTYGLLLATVLPANFWLGLFYIFIYIVGLILVLFLIAYWGQYLVGKLKWAANPKGWFRVSLGLVFVLIGVAIIFGLDRQFEAWLVKTLPFSFTEIEQSLLQEI